MRSRGRDERLPTICERCPTTRCPVLPSGSARGTAAMLLPNGPFRLAFAYGCYGAVVTVKNRAARTGLYAVAVASLAFAAQLWL